MSVQPPVDAGPGFEPCWLLDVDGVVLLDEPPRDRRDAMRARIGDTRGWYRPNVIEDINAVHAAGVSIRWLTSWGTLAREVLAPTLGLADFPVLADTRDARHSDDPGETGRLWWKVAEATAFLRPTPDKTIVWSDDEASAVARDAFRRRHGGPMLVQRPDPAVGLTRSDVDVAYRFLTGGAL